MEVSEAGKEAFMGGGGGGDNNEEEDVDLLSQLPPGFRFHPTDEEIILHYLRHKVVDSQFVARAIGEVDLNKCEPWDLPKKAKMGEKEWWFFCQRDRKYPTGMRTNRATESGYWKATGKDKEIFKGKNSNCLIGMKKTLVFYRGRAPKGHKSNWVMHEFRLEGQFSFNYSHKPRDEWVVCRVFHKSTGVRGIPMENNNNEGMDSFVDNLIHSPSTTTLPPLTDFFPDDCAAAATSSSSFLHYHHQEDLKPMPIKSSYNFQMMNHNHYRMLHQQNHILPPEYKLSLVDPDQSRPIIIPDLTGYNTNFFHPHHLHLPNYATSADHVSNAVNGSALLKVEETSNNNVHVSASQETGLSTDTTSAVSNSKHNVDDTTAYHDGGGMDGLDQYSFWDY